MAPLQLRKRAFTLIELLIVITIIGILAVALIPRLTGGPARARDAQRKADLQQIATALEFYNQDNGGYPATSACVSTLSLGSYLTTVPNDPSGLSSASVVTGGCATGYAYIALQTTAGGNAEGYLLIAKSESTTEVSPNGIYYTSGTWSPTTTATAATNLGAATACTTTTTCTTTVSRFYMVGR